MITIEQALNFGEWINDQMYNNVLSRNRSHGNKFYGWWIYHPNDCPEFRHLTSYELYDEYLERKK